MSRFQKVKTTSPQTHNHASTHHSVFLQARYPSCHPTNSVKALKAKRHRHRYSIQFSISIYDAHARAEYEVQISAYYGTLLLWILYQLNRKQHTLEQYATYSWSSTHFTACWQAVKQSARTPSSWQINLTVATRRSSLTATGHGQSNDRYLVKIAIASRSIITKSHTHNNSKWSI